MDGIIVINKPQGCTSHDIVYKTKKIFNQKVGHTGTLDPNATGVLPLLIGKGTQLSKYLINHDKIYEVVLQLGVKTDTADSEGNVIQKKEVDKTVLNNQYIVNVFNTFTGKQEQIPPMYSAIKVQGKKLYEYAREGKTVDVKPRTIEIYKIELLNIDNNNCKISFKIHCSKGTYIRSLCEDIAKRLNTVGYMESLNRVQVGCFNIKDAISIDFLKANYENTEFIKKHFITIEDFFNKSSSIVLDSRKLQLFLNGVKLTYVLSDGLYKIYDNANKFVGIGVIENKLLKRDIII